jgi:hypothetical protein
MCLFIIEPPKYEQSFITKDSICFCMLHFYKEKDQIFSLLVSLSSVLFETRRLTWPYGHLDNARWVSQVPNIYVSMNNMMGHVMYMYVREGFKTHIAS